MASWTAKSLVCVGVIALCPLHSEAQTVALRPSAKSNAVTPDDTEHPRGTYMGVKAGGEQAPAIPVKAGTTPAAVTWPGFQMQPDGSSRVFLQTTAPLDVSTALVDGNVVMTLGNAKVVGDTNRLPLYTQFFNSPVTRVEIKQVGGQTTLHLKLRTPVQPRVSSAEAASGFHFIYIDFPAGDYLGQAPPVSMVPLKAPGAAPGAATADAPDHLEGDVSGSASGAVDSELPPGMSKPKAKAKASGKVKIGL